MNRTPRAIFLFAVVIVAAVSCKNKDTLKSLPEDPDFQSAYSISSRFIMDTSQFEITIHLKNRFHAYAPGEKIGKPITLVINEANGWSADGPVIMPTGIKRKFGDLGESFVLEGDVKLSQKLKKGSGIGEAVLHLQVCTKDACDRPRAHRLPLIKP